MKNGLDTSLSARAVAEQLGGLKKTGNGYDAHCPGHDDDHASLSIRDGDGGKLLVRCHAGCSQAEVVEALKARDLWPSGHGKAPEELPQRVTTYDYEDEHGELAYQVVRYKPKDFRQRRPDGKRWAWNMKGVEPLPYRLPDILDNPKATVFIVEGEKDADNVFDKLELLATCNHGGAGKWSADLSDWFEDLRVVILPDNDEAGRKHAEDVARKLDGVAKSIKILALPDLPAKGDVSDWIKAGGTREELLKLVKAAPEWEPGDDEASEDDVPPEITELNQTYALVLVGDKAVVLKESPTALSDFSLLSLSAFRSWFANQLVPMGKRSVPLADYWLEHKERRQYEGIVFAPENAPPGHYNLWHGFAVEPKPGDCSKFLAHIRDNVCRGREAWYQWVIGWFAEIVQHPAQKSGTSLVIRGEQGTGKTIVGDIVGSLLGSHHVKVADPRYITGRFNSHLASCLLLHADEGFWAGDRAAEGKLKDLVTGTTHLVEHKGKEPFRLRNYVRLLVTGNPEWVVPAGMEERRFAVLEIGKDHQKDIPYFRAICEEMDHGGRAALLHHLLNVDLAKVDLRSIPHTAALLDQKLASLTAEQAWWLDLLRAGQLPGSGGEDIGVCKSSDLFDDYIRHADKTGVKRRRIETQVGMYLRKVVPNLRKRETERGVLYEFPSLRRCRERFCDLIDHDFTWSRDAEWTTRENPKSRFDRR